VVTGLDLELVVDAILLHEVIKDRVGPAALEQEPIMLSSKE